MGKVGPRVVGTNAPPRVCVCEMESYSVCVCVCETESLVGKVIKCVWLHHREVMCMAKATNEGVRERTGP